MVIVMSKQEKTTLYIIIAAVAFYLPYKEMNRKSSLSETKLPTVLPIKPIELTPERVEDIIESDDQLPEGSNNPNEMEEAILYPNKDLRQFAKACW